MWLSAKCASWQRAQKGQIQLSSAVKHPEGRGDFVVWQSPPTHGPFTLTPCPAVPWLLLKPVQVRQTWTCLQGKGETVPDASGAEPEGLSSGYGAGEWEMHPTAQPMCFPRWSWSSWGGLSHLTLHLLTAWMWQKPLSLCAESCRSLQVGLGRRGSFLCLLLSPPKHLFPASFCDHMHAFCWVHRLLVLRNGILVK